MFRISRKGKELAHADTLEQAREIVRTLPPGRYDVDELPDDPLRSGATPRAWGSLVVHPNGQVEEDHWDPSHHLGDNGYSS